MEFLIVLIVLVVLGFVAAGWGGFALFVQGEGSKNNTSRAQTRRWIICLTDPRQLSTARRTTREDSPWKP